MCSREERESRALTVWKEEGEEEGYSSKKNGKLMNLLTWNECTIITLNDKEHDKWKIML